MKKPISIVAFIRRLDVVGVSAINALRAIQPLAYLNNSPGFDVRIVDQEGLKNVIERGATETLLGHDLYVVSRLFAGKEGRSEFLEAIHGHGGLVIFDTDDDLSDDYRKIGRGEDFKGIINDVDAVTVTTPYLARHLEKYTGYKPWVLPNHVDVDWFAGVSMEAPRTVEGLTIGFIGTASHYDDWKYPVEALRQIALEHEDVTIVAAGYTPDYLLDLPRIVELEPVPYMAYPTMMRQLDLVICSLDSEDEFNKSKCVVGDTLVATPDGLSKIAALQKGDEVYTPDGAEHVSAKYIYKDRPVVTLATRLGYSIAGTPDHRIMTPGGWKELGQMTIGDKITLSPVRFSKEYQVVPFNTWVARRSDQKPMPNVTPSCPRVTVDENYGLLIGAILGDGHVTRLSTGITCDTKDMDWALALVETCDLIGVPAKISPASGSRRCVNVRINSVKFNEFLAHIGVWGGAGNQTGRHSRPKNFWVPDVMLRSPRSVIAAFLRGLFEADGTVSAEASSASFCTKSKRLAREVQMLLTGFGITSYLSSYFNKAYTREYYTVHLRRAEIDVFAHEIGFASARKTAEIAKLISKSHSNAYRPMKWEDEVQFIETGTADVFDVEIPEAHCYLAAGLVSHNSGVKALEAMSAARVLGNGKAGGAVAVCTDMPVYRRVVNNRHNGLLVKNGDWYSALRLLVEDKNLRSKLAVAGHKYIKKHKDIAVGYKSWGRAYREILKKGRH